MRPVIVTGGIASGKSTVLNVWRDMGVTIESADEIAQEVFNREPVQKAIAQELHLEEVTRDAVRRAMIEVPGFRKFLNNTTHPLIFKEIERSTAQAIEIPLAIETCIWHLGRALVVTWCPLDVVKNRLFERGLSEIEAQGLIDAQVSPDLRLAFADVVIRTNEELSGVLQSAREIGSALF